MKNEAKGKVQLPPVGQIGVVVKDLDECMEYYSSTFGIGPWRVVEYDFPEIKVRDKTYPCKIKAGFASLGPVELELIQVVEGHSIHSEFLDSGREGLHHLAFFCTEEEKKRLLADAESVGIKVTQGGKSSWHSGSFSYLDSDKVGGVIFELIHRPS